MAKRDSVFSGNQIEEDTVTNTELANITRGSIKVGGLADAPTDLVALTDAQILIGDGTDINSVAVSGDVTIDNAGATTIGAGAVDNAMLAGSIADGKLATDYVQVAEVDEVTLDSAGGTLLRIKALGVDTAQLALDAVDGTIIEDDAVDSEHYVDGSIDNQHIADDTILEAKIDATNAATDGYFLTFDNATGGFTWVESPATSGVQEADMQYDDFSATTNGILTDFTLTDIPVTKSLQVFINGQLVREGVGKGYQLNPDSGQTKTIRVFGDVLATGKKLEAYYVKDN